MWTIIHFGSQSGIVGMLYYFSYQPDLFILLYFLALPSLVIFFVRELERQRQKAQ